MKKNELERLRAARAASFTYPTDIDTAQATLAVQADVKPAQDAYSAIGQLVEQLSTEISRNDSTLKEKQAMAKIMRDLTVAIVALRQEGRATAGAMTNDELMEFVKGLVKG